MQFLKKWSQKLQNALETTILQRRKKLMRALRTDEFLPASALVRATAGSRASIEATLSELIDIGFVESQFSTGEPTMRRGSVRVYRRSKMGEHWLTSGKEI